MIVFALTLSPAVHAGLLSFVTDVFILFVASSFICVALYAARQIRAGRLFTAERAPLRLSLPSTAGWFFIASVVGFIYLQSPLYAVIVLVGTAALLAEGQRTLDKQFGFSRLRPSKALTWGILVFGAVMLVEMPLTGASIWILDLLRMPHPEQESVVTFRQYTQAFTILSFMVEAVFVSPIIEEFFFRGFLLTFLKNYTSTGFAIVLSAGVFAFAHLNLGAVLPLWFLGIVLGMAYEHTGSLLVPMTIHACFNLATGLNLLVDHDHS